MNGQAARAVIGQYTFTYGGATPGQYLSAPGQQILGGASGVAWANGTLFVADSNRLAATPQDNRVVMFNTGLIPALNADLTNAKSYSSFDCILCGYPAFNQLGQPSFTPPPSSDPTTTAPAFPVGLNNDPGQPNMRTPTAVASDGAILAVADTDNNRVLIWTSIPSSMNQPANLVLGQSNFTSAGTPSTPTPSSMSGPQGVWIQDGKLFVADTQNYRVLIWNSIPTSNNQPADVVLGQTNFSTGTQAACNPTMGTYTSAANELCNPVSVTSDGVHVFVADLGFNRVLIWNHIPTANGQNADVVVGQPDMSSAVPNNPAVCTHGTGDNVVCESNLNFPRFALSDGTRLFVADGGNDRVIIFNSIPTSNGAAADEVLGQPDFRTDVVTSSNAGIASTALDNTSGVDILPSPTSLALDGTNLYIADPTNNRVLVYTPGNTLLPDNSIVNWASEIIRQEGVVSFILAGGIVANDTATVTIQGTAYNYTIQKNDTLDTIAQGVVNAINAKSGDPNVTAIFAGAGTGSLYLSSKQINLAYDAISLTATTSNSVDITAVASGNGYLTAGTAATAAVGTLVEINGSNLSDLPAGNPAKATQSGTLPTSLGGAQVFMDGVAVPLYSVYSSQIISQVPFNFIDRNSTSVYVRTQHGDGSVTVTNASPVYIAPANPGIFDAPAQPGQQRPWPAMGAYHQPGNPESVVSIDGTVTAGNVATISVNNVAYNYTLQANDSLASVVTGLVNAINNAPDPLVTASAGAAFNRVVLTARQGGAAGNGIPIAGSVGSGATVTVTAYTSATCCNVLPGSPITANNPAAPNEVITLSAAGLGELADSSGNPLTNLPTGQPYTGPFPNSAYNSVSATVGSSTGQVVGAGLAQGSYGVYQVQVIVPAGQATNSFTPVYIAQNAYISNTVTIAVGPANSNPNPPPVSTNPITIDIDQPNSHTSAVSGVTSVAGWVIDTNAAVNTVQVSVDGVAVGQANYGGSRPDVCVAHPGVPGCPNVGYNYMLDTTQFADGPHTLQITATGSDGARLTYGASFVSSNYGGSNSVLIWMDQPAGISGPFQGIATFSGWTLDSNATISSVTVSIDGGSRGSASFGLPRPDVCAQYPNSPACPNVGWSYLIDTTTLANGTHTFALDVTASNGQHAIAANTFTVANWSTANPVTISIDKPNTQSGPLSGRQLIGGWSFDDNSTISSISVAVDGVPYGNASYGGNRSDVCAVFAGKPGCPNVGWSASLDTTSIPDGMHTLQITATPVSGQGFTKTVQFQVGNLATASNPTRIAIDTPGPSGPPVSGFAAIGGWALNDNAAITTLEISVDGNFNGYASYGGTRDDVCAKLPGRPGCPNVGWNYMLDTTILTNGSHSLQVTSTSATGERATASSTFSVANSGPAGPTAVSITQPSAPNSAFQGMALFSGLASSSSSSIAAIAVSVDGFPYGSASYTAAGPGASVNWTYLLNTVPFTDGTHTLGVTATATDGTLSVTSVTFQVANWASPSPIHISIDTPNANSTPYLGVAAFGGWVINPNAPVVSVTISIDGVPYGAAQYGGDRSDVCTVYPNSPGCPDVGWNFAVDTTLLANGTHALAVTATPASGQSSTLSSSFSVAN